MSRAGFFFALVAAVMVVALSQQVAASAAWQFDEALGLQYLYYSYATYCDPSLIEEWKCNWCLEPQVVDFEPIYFPYDKRIQGSAFVGVHHPNQTIVVAFRGSDSLANWIIDFDNIFKEPYRNYTDIYVGDGWQAEWNDLSPQVVPAVSDLSAQYPSYQIWVTGHSLGAAISIMCAAELALEGYDANVYNFGLPRVGDENFSDLYRSLVPNTFRVVNGRDIVPEVPFQIMGYYHVPTEVWENPASTLNFYVCDGSGEDPACDNSELDFSGYDHDRYYGEYLTCSFDGSPDPSIQHHLRFANPDKIEEAMLHADRL